MQLHNNAKSHSTNTVTGQPDVASTNQEMHHPQVAKRHTSTEGEYNQIMTMLNKDTKEIKKVSMTGITAYILSKSSSQSWVVDLGATHHMSTTRHMSKDDKCSCQYHHDNLHLSIGVVVDISHTGEAHIFGDELIKDVLFVPEFKLKFLSVARVTNELYFFISFYPNFYVFQNLFNGKVKGIGRKECGLYIFKSDWKEITNNPVNRHDKIATKVIVHNNIF